MGENSRVGRERELDITFFKLLFRHPFGVLLEFKFHLSMDSPVLQPYTRHWTTKSLPSARYHSFPTIENQLKSHRHSPHDPTYMPVHKYHALINSCENRSDRQGHRFEISSG